MPHDELTQFKIDMNNMRNDISNINKEVGELKDLMTKFIEKSESRFAGKWTEKAMVTVISAVGLAALGALLSLIIK